MKGAVGIVLMAVGGVAVIAALLYFAFAPVDPSTVKIDRASVRKADNPSKGKRLLAEAGKGPKRTPTGADKASRANSQKAIGQMTPIEDWFARLPSEADRKLGKQLQDAMDGDEEAAVLAAAEEAQKSKNAEVRQAAVGALSLQGTAAIPLLLKFITDSDGRTANAAFDAWDAAVDQFDEETRRAAAVDAVLRVATDRKHIEQAVGKIEMLDDVRALRQLTNLAESDNPEIAAAAKRSYENKTGEAWEGRGKALLNRLIRENDDQELKALSEAGEEPAN